MRSPYCSWDSNSDSGVRKLVTQKVGNPDKIYSCSKTCMCLYSVLGAVVHLYNLAVPTVSGTANWQISKCDCTSFSLTRTTTWWITDIVKCGMSDATYGVLTSSKFYVDRLMLELENSKMQGKRTLEKKRNYTLWREMDGSFHRVQTMCFWSCQLDQSQ